MYVDNMLFWTTILSGIIIGLVVGGILGLVGYFIWKRQHLYSKKLEAYSTLNNLLYDFYSLLKGLLKEEDKFEYYENKINDLHPSLKYAYLNFADYFETKYLKTINEVMDVYNAIKNKTNTMNEEDTLDYLNDRFEIIHSINFK